MADNLKDFYGKRVVGQLAGDLGRAYPKLDRNRFVEECLHGLDQLELLARAWQIADVMQSHLPSAFPRAAQILIKSLGPEYDGAGQDRELKGMETFRYLPHVFYASKYGLEDFDAAMKLQYELTKRFTAEFSIRAYIKHHPEATYQRLREWATDPNHHVRRLVSEGTRPRLPWAPRLKAYQADPTPVIALLDLLKDDPELYVRRSVANNLNDIAKDHPDLAVKVAQRWNQSANGGASEDRKWVIRHALRVLVKQGHPGALALQGFGAKPQVAIEAVKFEPQVVKVGEKLRFRLRLRSTEKTSTAKKSQTLLVDFNVHFVKSNGATSPKVFKLKRVELAAGESVDLSALVSFQEMTTRKHYPGDHNLELLVNGVPFPLGKVELQRS